MLNKEQLLTKFGLTDKEATVYVASLALGPSVAANIATGAKVNRGTIYDVLKSLVNKGLMSSYKQEGKVIFAPEEPDTLAHITHQEELQLVQQEQEAADLVPRLQSLRKGEHNHPQVRFYAGKEGILEIIEDFLKASPDQEVLSISSISRIYELFPNFDEIYRSRRHQKGLGARSIVSDDLLARKMQLTNDAKPKKLLPDAAGVTSDISIYDRKVSLVPLSNKQQFGVVIESHGFTKLMRHLFQLAWEGLGDK